MEAGNSGTPGVLPWGILMQMIDPQRIQVYVIDVIVAQRSVGEGVRVLVQRRAMMRGRVHEL